MKERCGRGVGIGREERVRECGGTGEGRRRSLRRRGEQERTVVCSLSLWPELNGWTVHLDCRCSLCSVLPLFVPTTARHSTPRSTHTPPHVDTSRPAFAPATSHPLIIHIFASPRLPPFGR